MQGRFITKADIETDHLDWGSLAWFSRPATTGAGQLVVIGVTIAPGAGHNFHTHPDQEEVIYVLEGRIQQWLETESQELVAGESVFVPKNTVHGSFNESEEDARLVAILGPSVGTEGYEIVDVSGEAPWNGLRGEAGA